MKHISIGHRLRSLLAARPRFPHRGDPLARAFWISPALSNYGMMNLFLFAELSAFWILGGGFGRAKHPRRTTMFFIVAIVGLDAEKPVAVQTVFSSYLGVVLPIFIAAIVGRLFWPVLSEAELRKRFIDFFSICSNFLTKQPGHGDDLLSDRLILIPNGKRELSWAKGLKGRNCPESEVEKILALTLTMRRLALWLSARARTQPSALPENIAGLIDSAVEKAREDFRKIADALTGMITAYEHACGISLQALNDSGWRIGLVHSPFC